MPYGPFNRYYNVQRRKPASKYYRVPMRGSAGLLGSALSLGRTFARRAYSSPTFPLAQRSAGTAPYSRAGARIARSFAAQTSNSGPDLKSVDLVDNVAFDNAGAANTSIHLLNGIASGSAAYQRVGARINAHSIRLRWQVILTDNVTVAIPLRVALVWDRMPNAALPTYSEIFADQSSAGAVSTDTSTFVNVANLDRFKVLREEIIRLRLRSSTLDVTLDSKPTLQGDWYVKLSPLVQTFLTDGDDATITSIKQGALYLVAFNSNYTAAQAFVSISFGARYNYTDQ